MFNEAKKVELSTLTTEQLRVGVHNLGQIPVVQALPERQFDPDSPSVTPRTANGRSFLSSEGSTEANEGRRRGRPGRPLAPPGVDWTQNYSPRKFWKIVPSQTL